MHHADDNPTTPPADSAPGEGATPAPELAAGDALVSALETAAAPPPEPFAHLPEDLRAPWGWLDLLIFVFFALGSLIVLTNALAALLMTGLGLTLAELEEMARKSALFVTTRQALWFGLLLLYLWAVIRVKFRAPFWRTIGWRRPRAEGIPPATLGMVCFLSGFVLAVVVQFASAVFGTKARLPIEEFFRDRQSVLLLMAVGTLLAPLVEELVFRGYLYPVLARSFGVAGGVLATGALFGLMHAPQLWGGWTQIGLLMAVGVAFTYARARTGSVLASYLLHLGYNFLVFFEFYFFTGGLRYFPTAQ